MVSPEHPIRATPWTCRTRVPFRVIVSSPRLLGVSAQPPLDHTRHERGEAKNPWMAIPGFTRLSPSPCVIPDALVNTL
jgi:hypothetical protein